MARTRTGMNMGIVFLCFSALFMLGLLASRSRNATQATTSMSTGSHYVMTSGKSSRTKDVLYIIDTTCGRMNTYIVERRSNKYKIRPVATRTIGNLTLRQLMQESNHRNRKKTWSRGIPPTGT